MTLWAKSGKAITLPAHTGDVLAASDALFGAPGSAPTRLAIVWLRFFKLPSEAFGGFRADLTAAAALHDIGKANRGFQDAVTKGTEQNIRHEHLSALIMTLPVVDAWLRRSPLPIDWDVVLSAVLGHHLKASVDDFAKDPAGDKSVRMLCDNTDFGALLDIITARSELAGAKPAIPIRWHFSGNGEALDIEDVRERAVDRLNSFRKSLRADPVRNRRLRAVRAALIAADAVGSTAERTGADIASWVGSVFGREPMTGGDIRGRVIDPRVDDLRTRRRWDDARGRGGWTEFQEHAADPARLPARSLLLAPCGAGKTLAAWRWIEACLAERPAARVVFLYPTRATATEGFRDYVAWAPEADADLMHGTAAYELARLSENPKDRLYGRNFETEDRLYALGHWSKRIFSATVDQFLSFLQYGYGAVCMLPALADSVVVVDEVHSFDPTMFASLCEFLREFDVPVLCMTATLPGNRVEELTRCGLKTYNDKPDDLKDVADRPRYRVRRTDRVGAEVRVGEALDEGKRVLWVVNRVARAQEIAAAFAGGRFPVHCYHSRFRLADRQRRHAEAVAAVRPDRPASLTVTTQVCEMSLDLDADVLVTEVAPVTALIQRMGRCNRHRDTRPGAGEVWVYSPGDTPADRKPYDDDSLSGVERFLETVSAKERISQTDLEEAMAALPRAVELPKLCPFIHGGPYADGREESFRDIEEFSVRAVLDRDVAEFRRLAGERRPTDGLMLPVPKRFGADPDPVDGLPKWLRVAPASHYDAALGFRDEPLTNRGPS